MMNNAIYDQKFNKKKIILFYFLTFFITVFIFSIFYFSYVTYRTISLYSYTKSHQRGWSGTVYKVDPQLGFSLIPNSQGAMIFPVGPNIPVRHDKDGFRIPAQGNQAGMNPHPIILTLGCSYTYGDATPAEDTYPYLVAKYLGGTIKNAGVCSYGLSQMLILSRELVPAHKPDYLVVQYSPWLTSRALTPFAPTYFGKLTVPFFYREEGQLALHSPVFRSILWDMSVDKYRSSPKGISDFLSFFWSVGLPLFIYDDVNMLSYTIKRIFGLLPGAATEREQVEEYFYNEVSKVAKTNKAQLLVVVLGLDSKQVIIPEYITKLDAIIVDAHAALLKHLPVSNNETYYKEYAHWRGNPPKIVDRHPNETAHRIIAEEIVSSIKQREQGDQVSSPRKAE